MLELPLPAEIPFKRSRELLGGLRRLRRKKHFSARHVENCLVTISILNLDFTPKLRLDSQKSQNFGYFMKDLCGQVFQPILMEKGVLSFYGRGLKHTKFLKTKKSSG